MKENKFRGQWQRDHYNPTVKKDKTEMTIPGQHITIAEAMRRMKAGIAVPLKQMAYDDPENATPRFKIKSVTDLAIAKKTYDSIVQRAELAKTAKDKKKEAEAQAALKERLKAETLAEINNNQ